MKNPFILSTKNRVDTSTILSLELNSYLGKWHEIARFNHRFEHGLTNVTANYILQEVTSGRSGKYLWILSRTATLPEETLNIILEEAERRNFDISRLIYI